MKYAFYFMLKVFDVLEIFTFSYWFFFMQKNSLIRKLILISKFITSQTGQHMIAIPILPKRSKGNQAMKFAQLTKYKMINTFL